MSEESAMMQEAIVTMYELSQEQKIKEQCRARILYNGDMNGAREKGINEGEQRFGNLTRHLIRAGRMDDLMRAADDSDYRKQLMEEFGL